MLTTITVSKEIVFAGDYLSACLFGCLQNNSKNHEQILLSFVWIQDFLNEFFITVSVEMSDGVRLLSPWTLPHVTESCDNIHKYFQ